MTKYAITLLHECVDCLKEMIHCGKDHKELDSAAIANLKQQRESLPAEGPEPETDIRSKTETETQIAYAGWCVSFHPL